MTLMYDPDSFRHTHEKILAAAGIEHIRFHSLIHTFAILLLQSGKIGRAGRLTFLPGTLRTFSVEKRVASHPACPIF